MTWFAAIRLGRWLIAAAVARRRPATPVLVTAQGAIASSAIKVVEGGQRNLMPRLRPVSARRVAVTVGCRALLLACATTALFPLPAICFSLSGATLPVPVRSSLSPSPSSPHLPYAP